MMWVWLKLQVVIWNCCSSWRSSEGLNFFWIGGGLPVEWVRVAERESATIRARSAFWFVFGRFCIIVVFLVGLFLSYGFLGYISFFDFLGGTRDLDRQRGFLGLFYLEIKDIHSTNIYHC